MTRSRATLALWLVACGLWAVFLGFLGLHLATPSDGARVPPGEMTTAEGGLQLEPLRPGGVAPGDVLLAVNGRSVAALAAAVTQPAAPGFEWAAGQTLRYTLARGTEMREVNVTLGPYPLGAVLAKNWGSILFGLLGQLSMALLFWRRPEEPAARAMFVATAAMVGATNWSLGLQVSDVVGAAGLWLYGLGTINAYLLLWPAVLHVMLVFPAPWPVLARHRWLLPALYAAPFAALALVTAAAGAPNALAWLSVAGQFTGYVQAVYVVLALGAAVRSLRAAHDPVSRAQVRWVATGFIITLFSNLALGVLPELVVGYPLLSWDMLAMTGLLVLVGFGVAILRYRLFDIDVILKRTLVYGALTAGVVGLYVLVVGGLGALLGSGLPAGQGGASLVVSLLATGLIAVAFQPARARVQRAVNRLLYGERDDPYTVLSRLGQRLEATLAPEAVLPALVETVAQALKLPYVAVVFPAVDSAAPAVAAAYGLPAANVTRLPLAYQGEQVGELRVAARGPGESFSPDEQRLLADIARQAGVAAHAVRLTGDLQRSRERLVSALEEERRRLRRDLHDGLGPQLASQTMTLSAARQLLRAEPERAEALLGEAIQHAQDAVTDIRRVVYALRPPALDDLGLAGALRAQAAEFQSSGVRFSLSVPEALPSLPAAVEVACYRIAQEAMTNVVKHARAQSCTLAVAVEGAGGIAIVLEVVDDGRGLPAERRAGVGLGSMRERAAELGGQCLIEPGPAGGTRVLARLPLGWPALRISRET